MKRFGDWPDYKNTDNIANPTKGMKFGLGVTQVNSLINLHYNCTEVN